MPATATRSLAAWAVLTIAQSLVPSSTSVLLTCSVQLSRNLSAVVPLQGLVREGGHGKLLLDKGLYPKSYATNVNEQWLNQLNLVERTRTAVYDLSTAVPACLGTHSIVYSNISQQ